MQPNLFQIARLQSINMTIISNIVILGKAMKTMLKQPDPFSLQGQTQPKTLHLKPRKKQDSDTKSVSNNEKSAISTNQLLSSISTKLNPRSISISGERRWSGVTTEKIQIKVSCLDGLKVPSFYLGNLESTLNYEELRRNALRKKLKSIVSELTCVQKNKKTCGDQNCPLKTKWKNKLVLQIKDAKEAEKLKNYISSMLKQKVPYENQIDKDVTRSFPDKVLPKARLTLYHTSTQKSNLIQTLRTVLKMLAICDNDVGYVQGMNLFTAVIVSHMKQVQLSFMFVRQVMKYGNMRKMYVSNFKNMKELCHNLLHRHVKILVNDLYEAFMLGGIVVEMFMPFYLSMFACVVDYGMMHCVIDQFMAKGFLFLDKLMLSMLCYMKMDFMECDPADMACKLGASYIRSCQVPWDEVINLTQIIELN